MHVIVWEFKVRPERIAEFVEAYGPEGDWARLFRKAEGYLGTELMVGDNGPACFLTTDRWRTSKDFDHFKEQYRAEYDALDARLSGLTTSERKVGSFDA